MLNRLTRGIAGLIDIELFAVCGFIGIENRVEKGFHFGSITYAIFSKGGLGAGIGFPVEKRVTSAFDLYVFDDLAGVFEGVSVGLDRLVADEHIVGATEKILRNIPVPNVGYVVDGGHGLNRSVGLIA